jgi:hypothetical protein
MLHSEEFPRPFMIESAQVEARDGALSVGLGQKEVVALARLLNLDVQDHDCLGFDLLELK